MQMDDQEKRAQQEFEAFQNSPAGKVLNRIESIYNAQMSIRSFAEIQTILLICIAIAVIAIAVKLIFF